MSDPTTVKRGHRRAAAAIGPPDLQLIAVIEWPADAVPTSREEAVFAYADAVAADAGMNDADLCGSQSGSCPSETLWS